VSSPNIKRALFASAITLALTGGQLAVLADPSTGPLSTAGVNPRFDWGDGDSQRSQSYLRGSVQVQRAAPAPASAGDGKEVSPAQAGDYVGTPAKVTLHGMMPHVLAGKQNSEDLDRLFAMVAPKNPSNTAKNGHFHVNFRKAVYKGKNVLNYMFDYRAFGPSTEAADLILEEHSPSKSGDAKAYFEQRRQDEASLQIASNIMQLAMGLGASGTPRGQRLTETSLASLRQLIGNDQTDDVLATLQSASKKLSFPRELASQEVWDMQEREDKINQMVQGAANSDAVLDELKHDLHRYNRHSKITAHAIGAMQTALSVAAFTPTLAAPAAETTYFMLMLATGGPEQDKLLRELYLSKRMEDRLKFIKEKAHMAVDTYHMALLSENALLLNCTQAMVRQMSGDEAVREVFGGAELAHGTTSTRVSSPVRIDFGTPLINQVVRSKRKEQERKPDV
jgi:hypothetical protein